MKTNLLLCLPGKSFTPNERKSGKNIASLRPFGRGFSVLIVLIFLLAFAKSGYSQNNWNGGTNWGTATNWSLNHVPTALEDVVIPNGSAAVTVNINAVCKSLTFASGGSNNNISISSGQSLTVTNLVTINAPTSGNKTKSISVNTGTLTCGGLVMAATTNANRICQIDLSTGIFNLNGDITMNGTAASNVINFTGAGTMNFGGSMLAPYGGSIIPSTGTVNCNGANPQTLLGANTTSFYNLIVNKTAAGNSVTSTTNAIDVANDLTVTQGNLILMATDADYTIANDLNVASSGTLTHSVDWGVAGKLLGVSGNIAIDGIFNYTVRSHVQMLGTGTKYVRTGSNASSAFSILTLLNGNFYANGQVKINDNFWAMFFSAGSFHTNGQTVTASASLLNANGTVYIDGGTLNVTGGFNNGYSSSGTVNFSSGTLNTDALNIGSGATGTFIQSAGTANINGNLSLTTGTYTCSGSPAVNISGNWTNNISAAAFVPATSLVTFNNTSGAQNITGSASAQTFGNFTVNKSGQQLNITGSTSILNINATCTLIAGTFAAGTATTINESGNWINNGGTFMPGAGTVNFNGSLAQTISGSTITSFNNLTLSNSNGLSLSSIDASVNGGASALNFISGKITTGANKLALTPTTTIAGAGAGKYVYGNLQMGVPIGTTTRVFEIGDASSYAPVSVIFNSVTVPGNVTGYTIATEHPNILTSTIDESRSVNRYWGLSNSGTALTSYTPTFNFQVADIDAGATPANFIVGRRTSSWAYPTMGLRNPTNTTTTLGSFGEYAIGEGGAGIPVMVSQPADQALCAGSSTTFTASANNKPNSSVLWQISTDGGSTFSSLTIASPYSVSTTSAAGVTTSVLTVNPVSIAIDGYTYRAVFTNSRGSATSFDGALTINPAPTVNAGAALIPICGTGISAPLGGSVGGAATGGAWSTASGGTFTPNANTLNATWTPPVGFTGTATLTLTTSGGSCGTVSASKTQMVSSAAASLSVTPSTSSICLGAIQTLTASNAETSTGSSGTINLAIPDFSNAGITNTIAVAGIPAAATITGMTVTMNLSHPRDADLILNLRAPNGNILNLVNNKAGVNFTNTIVSSAGVTAFSAGTAPYTATFKADAASGVGATGQSSNVTTFPSLYGTPNGNWVFSAKDNLLLNTGSITSWSIAITYMDPVTWSPVTGLYTNAGATTAYVAGTAYTTVYAKPATTGNNIYTATATNGSGCTSTQTATVTPGPVVTITPDYCYGGGFIQLTATSTPAATSWLWNTGATTSSILVDLAGLYQATATTAGSCVATASSSIAQELVVNGDFSAGNTGFTSAYGYVAAATGGNMYPEGIYTVDTDPSFHHSYFFGRDHTTNTGKFMIINGSGSTVNIWQENLAVQPNTTYYFSAWAISLNNVPPYAQLQFDVNGSAVGTTAVLAAGPTNNSAPYNWVRFYGNWTSGAGVTSATVSIKDLQTALGGNDVGLDDISFGTLSTFVSLSSSTGTDNQTVCRNTPLTNITYSVGSGSAGPTVTGLPPGVTSSFNGVSVTISGTPTTNGTYNYTITTTGTCNPVTATGTILVQEETISLSSAAGTDAQVSCFGTAITNITYNIGGAGTGASVTGLPAGIAGSYSAGVFMISGTATVSGIFTYTITTTGTCTHVTTTGSMNIRRQIITRSSPAGTNAQTVCINTAITNITYSIGGTATGAGVTGLPSGVSGSLSGSVFTISGTPTAAGVFSYTVTTTGTCSTVTATGSITVTAQTIMLASAAGTDAQSICQNSAITSITYNIGGTATNASITAGSLPAGVTGSFSAGVFTISGTATATGVFNYTITTSGTCAAVTASGSITVGAPQTIGLTSGAGTNAQAVCINTGIATITYSLGGGATGAGVTGLPAGVTGVYSAGIFTISGTPTIAGIFNYTITTTGSCTVATASGSITVNQSAILLSSAAGTDAQTKCIGTAFTNITYNVSGAATGAGVMGLPAGLTGSYSSGVFTISGTPTAAGVFNYTVTTTGTCAAATASGTITVTTQTITLSSAAGTDGQTKCINTAITNITYAVGGTGTGASITSGALPAGVTGSYSAGVFTISGTPTAAGVFNYTITTTGTCAAATASGTITVTKQTITLSSAAGTDGQTKCINTAITNITYTVGGTGTVASITSGALPAGVTGSYSAGVFTISGTPTVAGVFNYTVTTTGTCAAATASGTITVTTQTITLSSAAGTDGQTKCIGTAITNITYAVGGTGTGASITSGALPAGVTGSYSAGVFTISGTPTAAGVFNYTITTTGTCATATASGTITVTTQTMTLSSAAGTDGQTKCVSTAITNITYAVGGTGTGASITSGALPAGVTGSYSAGVFTISGTPTAAGVFNYTVTTTGTCAAATASGTITVTTQTITLSSAAGTDGQTKCINTAITNITYAVGGTGTGASITSGALPAGVTGSYSAGVFTISGTPTAAGVFNYTITTTGTCTAATASGTITVTTQTITLSSAAGTDGQTKCIGTAITNITYTVGGTGTGASITSGALPAGVTGSYSAGVFTILGTPTVAGVFSYTITTSGTCATATASGTITVTKQTITLSSAVGTDGQTKCIGTAITNITYAVGGTGTGASITSGALPAGVTGSYSAGVFTILGTPTVAGVFSYTITTSGTCATATTSGTITVTTQTITLSSAVGTDGQTKCIGTAITNITYTVGGTGTGASITSGALPAGVTGSYSAGVFTISGTPTVAGVFSYTITTTGTCATATASGTITVTTQTITLSSAAGTDGQTKCIGTAITNITYTVGGTGTGASITSGALPAGVTGSYSAGVFTILGTPTVAGVFNYTVTTTGTCATATASGTITVTTQTITLSSAAGTDGQTKCISTAISNITYTVGGTGTGASITSGALPAGVTGSYSAGVFTISGTPTVAGVFNYTITTTGTCATATASGTITVTTQTITLSSAAGTDGQTKCIGTAITNITYTVGGTGTGASITSGALPAGVTGSYSAGVFTILGTPTVAGVFSYTITTTGTCAAATASGTITVTKQTITLSSAAGTDGQTKCIGTAITNITYAVGGTGTGASITSGALPAGVTGSYSAGVFTISGTPTAAGVFNYTITTTGTCATATASGTITVTTQTITLSSAAGTDGQTKCIGTAITNITYAVGGTGTGASITSGALPAGVTGSYSAGVFTILGTPTVAGVFSYTITTSGTCATATASGTITVTKQTITLSSAAGTDGQTKCIGTAITNITYTVGGTGTGASITSGALPAGVTGSFSAGVFTISGTPTVAGVFSYTITTSGTCAAATASGTITVTTQTITLSSAAGTDGQSKCIGTAITNITYTVGGTGTGASITSGALPAGVTGSYSAGVFTILGTPTVAGVFSYTITTTGTCATATASGTITVTKQTITLSSAAGTDGQTKCIGTAITNITYAVGGTGTGASITSGALPAGVTGSFSAGVFTISGTPTVAGVFNYTITTTGTCATATASGTITVTTQTITLSSAAGTDGQTKCIGTAITNITYTVGGTGTGASITSGALPAGVTGSFSAGVFTISGTPTVAGVFNYTVTTTGTCAVATASGTITVTTQTITLSSAAGTDAQTKCIGTAITNIIYAIGGTGTGASITSGALPAGVTGSYSAGVFTISGTPTVAGVFNYTITTTGTCAAAIASGTITVTKQTITLSSAAGTDGQTKCISTAITNITYAVGGTGTGAFITSGALPAGVTGSFSAGVFTISGTPTVAGVFNYTITTTGTCAVATASGTITVTTQTITLSSAAGTDGQTKCIGTAITNITYAVGGTGTGASITSGALPAGVTGSFSAGVFTISGTPTVAGVFNYTITTTGTCATATASGTITVTTQTITRSSSVGTDAQTLCIATPVTNITYIVGGSATGAGVTGLPAGVSGAYSGGIFTISGTPSVSGVFNYTITTTGSCTTVTATGSITVTAASFGGSIVNVSICSGGSGNLSLTGNIGTITRWEKSANGTSWTNISNTTNTQSFSGLTATTYYRALVQNGSCGAPLYSNTAKVGIHNLWTGVTSSDWNTGSNWSDDMTPTTSCPDVTIPILTAPNVYPQLTYGIASVNNLIVYPSATMVISNATLQVAGTISNAGTLIATSGTIEMNGTSTAQTLAGSLFQGNSIQNLIISNSNGVNLTGTNDTMKITGAVLFGTSNATFNTNNNLTLVSNIAGTASVGDMTGNGTFSGNNIIGNVTVERYIPVHPKAWQLLAAPTKGQNVVNSWMEGNTPLGNAHPGFGTIITSNVAGAVALGFDIYTASSPSMKTYNPATNAWDGISSPQNAVTNAKGYLVFVRGDRSVTAFNQAPTPTTLRTTGKLYTVGAEAPPVTTVLAGKFESVSNPYASAIDFRQINKTAAPDVDDNFYVWDPLLTNNYYGLGGYQTISAANGWKPIPGGTANYDAAIPYPYVQSGQAFFAHATGAGGTLTFNEQTKVSGSELVNRVVSTNAAADRQYLRARLYYSSGALADGNAVVFDPEFSNSYDASDALKITNLIENFGVLRSDKNLAVEARKPVAGQDTIFYNLTNMRSIPYQFRFGPEHMDTAGLTAVLMDRFLSTASPVSLTDSTTLNFTVTSNPASAAANRFYLVFNRIPAPVIAQFAAGYIDRGNRIKTEWTVANEAGMDHYDVQRSADTVNFSTVSTTTTVVNNGGAIAYASIDQNGLNGISYYRIRGTKASGQFIYSSIVKVLRVKNGEEGRSMAAVEVVEAVKPSINVYPNPVINKTIHIEFKDQPAGNYRVELVNRSGQIVYRGNIRLTGKNTLQTIQLERSLSAGDYRLTIVGENGNRNSEQLLIQ